MAEIGQAVHVGLMDLQQRIGELQRSVETLAAEGTWAEPIPAHPHLPPPPPLPHLHPPAPASLAPAEWEQPFEPPFPHLPSLDTAIPAPVAAPVEQPAPPPGVTQLDAGPFADLIELRHFEEALAAVPGVHDVRVRRFGHGRARIEVGTGTTHELMAQIGRTYGPTEISERPGGEIVVEIPAPAPSEDGEGEGDEAKPAEEPAGEAG